MPGRPQELKAVCSSGAIKANEEHLPLSLICSKSCEKLGPAKLFQLSQELDAFWGGRQGGRAAELANREFRPSTLNLREVNFCKVCNKLIDFARVELSDQRREQIFPPPHSLQFS